MARKDATGAILASLLGGGGMGGGIGKRGQMGNVGGMTGGGLRMGGMVQAKSGGFGGDPMLNPNTPINAPDRQLNAWIDDKMQQWIPTTAQKQQKLDDEMMAKLMPQLAGNITSELIQGLQTQMQEGGMSPQGQINVLGGAYGLLDQQRQRDMEAMKNDLALKKLDADIAKINAQTAKVNAGGGSGSGKKKKGEEDLVFPGGGGAY